MGIYAVGGVCALGALRKNMHMRKTRHFLKEWRKERGLTQIQLAEKADVTQSMVSRVEGGSPYDEEFLERVAVAMNLTLIDILRRDPSAPEPFWSIWDDIPETNRELATEALKVFTRKKAG